jgi:hypothetical protein
LLEDSALPRQRSPAAEAEIDFAELTARLGSRALSKRDAILSFSAHSLAAEAMPFSNYRALSGQSFSAKA